jgi:hypothetical protein
MRPLTKETAQVYHNALNELEAAVLSNGVVSVESLDKIAELRYLDGIFRAEVTLSNTNSFNCTVAHAEMLAANSSKVWLEMFNKDTVTAICVFLHQVVEGRRIDLESVEERKDKAKKLTSLRKK